MSDRARPGPAARVAIAFAAAVAVLVAVAAVGGPARAQEPPAPGAGEPTAATTAPHLDLVSQTPFVAPTDILRIGLDVAGAPEGAELTFTLRTAVTTPRDQRTAQARFDEWVGGKADASAAPHNSPRRFPLANLPPADGSGHVDAAFEIAPDGVPVPLVGFQIADAGVYPLTIELSEAEGGAVLDSLTTFLVRLPARTENAPPLTVAPIAPIRAPVALAPDGTRSIEPSSLDRIHELIEALADAPDTALTLAATPETLEALYTTAAVPATDSAPTTTGPALVDRLQRALSGRSVLGSTYVTIDVSAWTASGMGDALEYQRSHGANVTEAVLAGAAAIDERTWLADPTLTADGLAELHTLGVDQVVLDSSVVGPLDAKAFPDPARSQVALTQPFDVEDGSGERVRAVTADATFGRRLLATDDAALNAQILVADLAVTYFGAMSPQVNDVPDARRGVTFQVPDDELASRSLAPFLDAISTAPPPDGGGVAILEPATLEDLFALPPAMTDGGTTVATRAVTPAEPLNGATDMGDYPTGLDAAEHTVSAYESMVLDTSPERILPLRQLLDVSGAAELDVDERRAYLDAATDAANQGISGVHIPEQDSITLTASEYEVPIFIENDLSYPVAVRVELASTKLTFPDGPELEVQLQPGSNRVPIRVKTVSAGTFPLDIAVSTPDQRVDLGSEVIEMRSTAVSGLGLALTIGAGFFLLVWWARNWRKTRRTGVTPPADPSAVDDGDATQQPATAARFTVGPLAELDDVAPGAPTAGGTGGSEPVGAGPGGAPPEPHQ